jgi:glucose/arabinose dehydrogenase
MFFHEAAQKHANGFWANLILSALKPGDVRRLKFKDDTATNEEIIISEFGRIRHVSEAPDGSLILLTDEKRKRGKLIRISSSSTDQ